MFQKFNVIETWLGFFGGFFCLGGGRGGCKCCTTVLFTKRVSLIFSIRVLVWNNNILYLSFAICSKSRKFRLYYEVSRLFAKVPRLFALNRNSLPLDRKKVCVITQNVVLYRESLAFINEKRFFYLLHWAPWDFVISINRERERERVLILFWIE